MNLILIFILKLVESAISTRQYQHIAEYNRYKATLLAGISCAMWIVVLKMAILDNVPGLIAYIVAYTIGVFLGCKGRPLK